MKIVVAPNAFKGSMDGLTAAVAIRRGIQRVSGAVEVDCIPVADGGDGLVEVLANAMGGKLTEAQVSGPLKENVIAEFCIIQSTKIGIVEMAKASGLVLIEEKLRNPEKTTTYGTGELIKLCLDNNIQRLVIGLGGSATCDGGIGAASALGYTFLDKDGKILDPIGENLIHIHTINTSGVDKRIFDVKVDAVCDVANPLTGKNGASYVYSAQKGASQEQVRNLDEGLQNLAEVIERDLGVSIGRLPGGGAAGGLGAGVYAFMGGKLEKGIDLVLDILDFREKLKDADLVITGEGKIDNQTIFDKAPAGVARSAKQAGVPCIAICGSIGSGIEQLHDIGLDAVFSLLHEPFSLDEAIAKGERLLEEAAEQIARFYFSMRNTDW